MNKIMLKNKLLLTIFIFVSIFASTGCEAAKKVSLKGILIKNTNADTVLLFNALDRNKSVLEEAVIDSKGVFRLYYNPEEIGYYVLNFGENKNILCVLVPNGEIVLKIDANIGIISKSENSSENKLLSDYQNYLLYLEKRKDSLLVAHRSIPNSNIQSEIKVLDNMRMEFLAELCSKNPDNFATAALMENLDYADYADVFDSVFTTLAKKYPKSKYILYKKGEVDAAKFLLVGSPAPDFTLPDTNGVNVSLSSLKSKVVVIDFWASWCRPCRQESPNMVKLYNDFHAKGLEIMGVSLDGDKYSWMQAIHKDGLYWIQVSDLKRWSCAAAQQYRVNSIPFTVLIDREGKIVAKGLRGEELHKKVQEIIDK